MYGNKMGFISYEDKILELKNYIETKISDIINTKYHNILEEADDSTLIEDIIIHGQFYLNPANRVVYMYISTIIEDVSLYNIIKEEFNRFIYEDERVDIVISTPLDENPPTKLDKEVFSYWINYDGKYEFLRDKRMHDFDKYNKIMEYEYTKFNEYEQQLMLLNSKYNNFINHNDIPVGFNEYIDIYKLYFDRTLYGIIDNNVIRFKLSYEKGE